MMTLRLRSPLVALCCAFLLAACGTASFYPHESRENVYQGKGGSRFVVEGIDVWFNGDPPRKYSILGYIEDNTSVGVDDRHQSIASAVLRKAREVSADALIETVVAGRYSGPSSGVVIGGGTGGMGVGFGFGFPVSEPVSIKYTVLRYLD
ncbi:hypothetical protein [Uliginosibacterium sp. H1]|uniref:hypothetical protein n=1 Tax=Uliginosibacterium sp. H1 TaxID=3114757 RepID=UPI002E18FE95|nr:hypothetical protein [Uliginosibacterium sp. H1]